MWFLILTISWVIQLHYNKDKWVKKPCRLVKNFTAAFSLLLYKFSQNSWVMSAFLFPCCHSTSRRVCKAKKQKQNSLQITRNKPEYFIFYHLDKSSFSNSCKPEVLLRHLVLKLKLQTYTRVIKNTTWGPVSSEGATLRASPRRWGLSVT